MQEIRLLACPRCGAPNSAGRQRCGRCREGFDEQPALEGRHIGNGAASDEPAIQPESAGWLVLITVVSAVAIVAVGAMMLSARGIGPLGSAAEEPVSSSQVTRASVERITASSQLTSPSGASYPVANLVDGDPSTAWHDEEDGSGTGKWVELKLADAATISGLLVWNGSQQRGVFDEYNRVRALRIEFPDVGRVFTVELLDREGPLAVDLPEPVRADRVRLTIESVFEGERVNDTALSEVEVLVSSGT